MKPLVRGIILFFSGTLSSSSLPWSSFSHWDQHFYELFTFHYAPLHVSNSFSFARFYYIFSFSSFTTFTDSLVPLALLGFQKFDRGWTYIPMSQDYLVHFCCDIISAKLFHSWGDIFVAGCINLVLVCSSSGEDSRFEGREQLAIVRLRKAKMYKQNFQPQRIW